MCMYVCTDTDVCLVVCVCSNVYLTALYIDAYIIEDGLPSGYIWYSSQEVVDCVNEWDWRAWYWYYIVWCVLMILILYCYSVMCKCIWCYVHCIIWWCVLYIVMWMVDTIRLPVLPFHIVAHQHILTFLSCSWSGPDSRSLYHASTAGCRSICRYALHILHRIWNGTIVLVRTPSYNIYYDYHMSISIAS